MKYFEAVSTLEGLRKQYKDLLKVYHPDNGGSEEICKAINEEYGRIFADLKAGKVFGKSAAKESFYDSMKWDAAEDQALREKLSRIIHFADINITLVGNWIWIDGNTYAVKNDLKAEGFRWAKEKRKWYWHSEAFRKRSRKKLSFDDICGLYGAQDVQTEARPALA